MNVSPLHVHQFGEGRPLLALHGITAHGARWRRFGPEHLPGFRVIGPDLRGHGRSTHLPPWTLEQHAADVLGVLDELGLDRIPVMGHSYGGAVALYLAQLAPERIERLLLLDHAIGLSAEWMSEFAEGQLTKQVYFADRAEARAWLRDDWPGASEEALDDETADHLAQDEDGRWYWRYHRTAVITACSEMTRPHVVPPAGTRTLVVQAMQDDFVRPEFLTDAKAVLGDDLVVAEIDCGHMVYINDPTETGRLMRDFLTEQLGSSG
ncbi:putative hydrolase, alpha/beta fold LipV [Longimycelium tulufanense]|uniref:Putative hydrolase, alpha/beta fold LipV n=1 Tax=Longimycelium tulufanense TaxID=907463 RepID=A0A8J3CAY1_9PSEU|nr:alpha/beta hydrolase [Longimycelium tulufanense]GGM42199.1 putative hydrolase, alpha/beta fold LipV [Longimycelium tulufanense]